MSACNRLDIDNGICTSEVLSDEAIVEIVNPPNQHDCDSEYESDDNETENPPRAVTTNEAMSFFTLIYFEQQSSLPKTTNYLDIVWAMKWDNWCDDVVVRAPAS